MTSVTSTMWERSALRCLLDRKLDGGVALVVEKTLEAAQLALRVLADAIGHVVVLALDDRPHVGPPTAWRPILAPVQAGSA